MVRWHHSSIPTLTTWCPHSDWLHQLVRDGKVAYLVTGGGLLVAKDGKVSKV